MGQMSNVETEIQNKRAEVDQVLLELGANSLGNAIIKALNCHSSYPVSLQTPWRERHNSNQGIQYSGGFVLHALNSDKLSLQGMDKLIYRNTFSAGYPAAETNRAADHQDREYWRKTLAHPLCKKLLASASLSAEWYHHTGRTPQISVSRAPLCVAS